MSYHVTCPSCNYVSKVSLDLFVIEFGKVAADPNLANSQKLQILFTMFGRCGYHNVCCRNNIMDLFWNKIE
uniref:Uncharacterized protein n=1 Tax=viral metagenome TaxID=1070528 RepID=A0A6C0C9N8_9ZZZZ